MTNPISPQQLAANQANATKSTGPRTEEGKLKSSQNARKHGFCSAKFAVVRMEELAALQNLRLDAIRAYRPVNSQELFAVERIALAQLTLLRCAELEAGLFTAALNETTRPDGMPANLLNDGSGVGIRVQQEQNRALCVAEGFRRQSKKSDAFKLYLRYQAQTERMYRRALEDFDRLKALRSEMPDEAIDPNQPEELKDPDPIVEWRQDEYGRAFYDPTFAPTSPVPPRAVRPEDQ